MRREGYAGGGTRGGRGREAVQRALAVAGAALLVLAPGVLPSPEARVAHAGGPAPAAPAAQSRQVSGGFRLEEATIEDVHRAMGAGELTAARLVEHYLRRVEAYNGRCVAGAVDAASGLQLGEVTPVADARQVNALTVVNVRGRRSLTDRQDADPEKPDALETARRLDAAYAATGRLSGPLHGIPVVIKDQFDTADMRTTSGAMAPYADDRPPTDAEVVARLREAGAVILGKANMGEYAAGDRSTFGGVTCNPYDTTRSAGRSSGGSGAAVAANLAMCALGEETGPSARNPAANNSLVGIVATHSLVSRAGLIPASVTRDRPGVLCRTVRDAAVVLGAIAGPDTKDPATAASAGRLPADPVTAYRGAASGASLAGVRVGVIREFMIAPTDADRDSVRLADAAVADLARLGAEVVDPVDFRGAIAAVVPALEPSVLATSATTVRDNAFLTATALPGIAELLAIGADPSRLPAGVNLRSLSELGLGAATTGEVRFMLNAYLQQRGDAAVRSVDDLLAGSVFYQFPYVSAQTLRTVTAGRVTATRTVPGDGITEPADRRLFGALYRTDDLPDGTRSTAPSTTLDARGAVVRRATLQAIVAKVMADQRLDALVYPTKTIPAPVLGAAVAPTVDNRPALAWALSPIAGLPTVAVPAGFTREVLDWLPPPVLTQEVLVDGTPTPVRVYDPDRYDPRRFAPPKAIALPVSLDFLG